MREDRDDGVGLRNCDSIAGEVDAKQGIGEVGTGSVVCVVDQLSYICQDVLKDSATVSICPRDVVGRVRLKKETSMSSFLSISIGFSDAHSFVFFVILFNFSSLSTDSSCPLPSGTSMFPWITWNGIAASSKSCAMLVKDDAGDEVKKRGSEDLREFRFPDNGKLKLVTLGARQSAACIPNVGVDGLAFVYMAWCSAVCESGFVSVRDPNGCTALSSKSRGSMIRRSVVKVSLGGGAGTLHSFS